MFVIFWKTSAWVIEMDVAGSHQNCHSSYDIETTTNVRYAPEINSISQLIKETINSRINGPK